MADVNLDEGVYDAARLVVGSVVVVEKNSGGIKHEAKLPSGTLTFSANLVVKKGASSAMTFDVIAARSLHTTGNGTFMFFPVVKVNAQSDVAVQRSGPGVYATGGKSDFDATLGMDEGGMMRNDFSFGSGVTFDVLDKVIRVIPPEEKQGNFAISASAAIDAAVKSGYLDSAISVTTATRANIAVWKVVGVKKLLPAVVYIDAETGAVAAKE